MGRPVISIGRAWVWESAASNSSGPVRTTRICPTTPQHMWPFTMKASPPNIRFSMRESVRRKCARTRFARASSNGMIHQLGSRAGAVFKQTGFHPRCDRNSLEQRLPVDGDRPIAVPDDGTSGSTLSSTELRPAVSEEEGLDGGVQGICPGCAHCGDRTPNSATATWSELGLIF
jgi:hypothetical protein